MFVRALLTIAVCLLAGCAPVPTQTWERSTDTDPPRPQRKRRGGPDAIFVATPKSIVQQMLDLVKIQRGDIVYDLGSGDGRFLIEAAKQHGCLAIGYEIDRSLVMKSRALAREQGVEELVSIREEDLFAADFGDADVVILYLGERNNKRLIPKFLKLKPGTRILSHEFTIPGYPADRLLELTNTDSKRRHRIHLWRAPLKPSPARVVQRMLDRGAMLSRAKFTFGYAPVSQFK